MQKQTEMDAAALKQRDEEIERLQAIGVRAIGLGPQAAR